MSTPTTDDKHDKEKEELLTNLLSAVQGCQVRFGGRAELATESDGRVSALCGCLEVALSHGLKARSPTRGLAAIKQVKDIVTSGLNLHLTLPGGETESAVLWWYVRELLTRHEYERFLLLRNVKTDLGRGRSWIRSLLNEHSLERYMHILACDEGVLGQWYEPWALLRDIERAAMLPNLAAGLDSVLFAININNHELSGGEEAASPIHPPCPEPEALVAPTCPVPEPAGPVTVVRKRDLRKKKKKIPSQLISFDDDLSRPDRPDIESPLFHSAPTTCLSSPAPTNAAATPYADRLEKLVHLRELQQAKEKMEKGGVNSAENSGGKSLKDSGQKQEDLSAEDKPDDEHESILEASYSQLFENLLPNPEAEGNGLCGSLGTLSSVLHQGAPRPGVLRDPDTGSYKSSQSNISADSFVSSDGDGVPSMLTPVGGTQGLIPLSPGKAASLTYVPYDDATSVNSCQEAEDLCVDEGCERGVVGSPPSPASTLPSPASSDTTLTLDELKSAVLEISRARDVAERRRAEVAAALDTEMEATSVLRSEMQHQHSQHQEAMDKLNTRVNTITRENELLRHQLKKYVGAVQLLRREGGESPKAKAAPVYRDYHEEATAYETKLIQVAEMHGELMEFNERLHKLLRMREAQVRRLREELVDLRGPLPDDPEDDDDPDAASVTSDLDSIAGQSRTLVNIWIPTAFLAGTSSDTHHVYQIYIRIRDDEWNVYRRYAQFYELHKQLKKMDPAVKSFDFPQKKTFGYKEEGVVEERRVKLQAWVRQVVNLFVTTHPQLTTAPNKTTLTSLIPFFAEVQPAGEASRSKSRRGVLSRLSGGRDSQPGVGEAPQYNGL